MQDRRRDLEIARDRSRRGASRNPAALARRSIAPSSRVLPTPASPASSSSWPATGGHLGDPPVGEVQQVIPPDEDRADEGSGGPHGAKCRFVARVAIGQMTDDRHPARRRTWPPGTRRGAPRGSSGGTTWRTFMDVHSGFVGVTGQQFKEAHERDLAIEKDEGVHFERAWLDPVVGQGLLPRHRAEPREP